MMIMTRSLRTLLALSCVVSLAAVFSMTYKSNTLAIASAFQVELPTVTEVGERVLSRLEDSLRITSF